MSSKENMLPVQARKSKIPMLLKATGKGVKRAISPNATKSDPKRSPSAAKKSVAKHYGKTETRNAVCVPRKTLGELPCEQRKIVKVRRMINEKSSTNGKGVKVQTASKLKKTQDEKASYNTIAGFCGVDLSALPDQAGIEFETDDSALQSILDETGIQFKQPQLGNQPATSKLMRHTIAPESMRVSTAPPSVKESVQDFRKVCDDLISRISCKQPSQKRQCRGTEFKNEGNFNLKLTPSKTDFCTKYGVGRSVTFQGVPSGFASSQGLPGRTKVRAPDPFVVPGRCSMAAQTTRRLPAVGEDIEFVGTGTRHSLAPQTPLRVLKKVKDSDGGLQTVDEDKSNRLFFQQQTPGRVSLANQTPGRVSFSAQKPGRVSSSAQTPGTLSLAPQTPGRVSVNQDVPNIQNIGRFSLAAQRPGRVNLQNSVQKSQNNFLPPSQERVSLAPQTPGRVSLVAAQHPLPMRISLIEQMPGRVKKQNQHVEPDRVDTEADNQKICENLMKKFAMQTPGRIKKNENHEDKGEDKMNDENKENKQKEITQNKTPIREKPFKPSHATPLRIKLLQTEESTPKSSPQRVPKTATTKQFTPRRVKVLGTDSPRTTPRHGTPQEPQRVPKTVCTPTTPRRILITEAMTPQQCSDEVQQETPNRKTVNKTKQSDGVDLRTIWKTKKTPVKSPILKEVLTQEPESEVSTQKVPGADVLGTVVSTIKRKKTLTWADTLESCSSPELTTTIETNNEQWRQLKVNTQTFHNAMQDNPHQEKTTSSPKEDVHVTNELTNAKKPLDNMQLPICLTGSTSTYLAGPSGSIDVENKPNDGEPCSKADHSLVSHPTSFAQLETDSLLVSQPHVGHNNGNVLANKMQDEFLQKQIELFKEKERQLAQLQMQIQEQLNKTSGQVPVGLDHEVDDSGLAQDETSEQIADNRNEHRKCEDVFTEHGHLHNQNFSRNLNIFTKDFKYTSDNTTQGVNCSGQLNLDMNSNVTSTESPFEDLQTESVVKKQSSPPTCHSDYISGTEAKDVFCKPQKLTFGLEDNATPYILKARKAIDNEKSDQIFSEFQINDKCLKKNRSELEKVPLWTPLAMKTVAKQQSIDKVCEEEPSKVNAGFFDISSDDSAERESNLSKETDAKSDIDTSVVDNENSVNSIYGLVPKSSVSKYETGLESLYKPRPKTPPNKKSAFYSVGSTGLTLRVGSLSLRANTETRREKGRMHATESLHNSVLQAACERYSEALLDDEVARFMCRLSPGNIVARDRECCLDPVAKMLLTGDDMHFIPIEIGQVGRLNDVHINGSAFTKYAERAT